jgi:hypothetical protein
VLLTPSKITENEARDMVEKSREFLQLVEGVTASEA